MLIIYKRYLVFIRWQNSLYQSNAKHSDCSVLKATCMCPTNLAWVKSLTSSLSPPRYYGFSLTTRISVYEKPVNLSIDNSVKLQISNTTQDTCYWSDSSQTKNSLFRKGGFHLSIMYTLSTLDQWMPLVPLSYSQIHVTIFPTMAKLLHIPIIYKPTTPTIILIPLFNCSDEGLMLETSVF